MKNRRPIISLCAQSPLRLSCLPILDYESLFNTSISRLPLLAYFITPCPIYSSYRPIALNLLSLLILQSLYQFVPPSALLSSYLYHKIERAFGGQLIPILSQLVPLKALFHVGRQLCNHRCRQLLTYRPLVNHRRYGIG